MRILAVDPGSKRIGIAVSDPTASIAKPLAVIPHVSRLVDAAAVADLAASQEAGLIIIGQSLDEEGKPTFEGRRSARFAEALQIRSKIPIVLWDEAFTTRDARATRMSMGATRRKRSGHLDDLAAAILLQSYLDSQGNSRSS